MLDEEKEEVERKKAKMRVHEQQNKLLHRGLKTAVVLMSIHHPSVT